MKHALRILLFGPMLLIVWAAIIAVSPLLVLCLWLCDEPQPVRSIIDLMRSFLVTVA